MGRLSAFIARRRSGFWKGNMTDPPSLGTHAGATHMYTDFHTRSAFSFLQAASLPEDLVQRCADLGHQSAALMDRDNVSGAPRFYMAAKKIGMTAHLGAELPGADADLHTLLADPRTGWQNLCRLITSMKLRAKKGQAAASEDELREFSGGLICLTGEGPPVRARFEKLMSIYGPRNVYAEIQRHFHRDEEARNQAVADLARSLKLPLLATNGVRHAAPEERELFDALTAVRHKTTVMEAGRLLARNAERHLKPPKAMARLFPDFPQAIAETGELARRLQFTLADLGYQFPQYPLPPGETVHSFLRKRTEEGARQRYRPYHDRARRQIEKELALIEKLNWSGYFLIVWDLVQFCRREGILVQGRGSAANSAVCYSLGITAVDPVAMDLLFERFLSEERGEWPDIDLDLPSGERREEVIQYVYRRYGERGAAMTAAVITYRTRSAVREVGKALGLAAEQVDRLAKLLRAHGWHDAHDELAAQLRRGGVDPTAPRIALLVDLVRRIQGLPRHLGQHTGGLVLAAGRLDLGMLAALEEALPLVRVHEVVDLDLAHLPPDDPKVYAMLQRADTIGVFQVESRAQMATLPRLRPARFYDLVVEVAIIRPGPIVGQMVHPYLRRRAGREPVTYAHPALEPILARTLGVPLFQEQLLRIAMAVAGFSGGEAEELRRAMGFKRSVERMAAIEARRRAGMTARGITGAVQEEIVRSITSFALYGFPESHAASFALIAYASAYLKAHHPAAFVCALLNCWPMGFYHPATLVKDAERHGVVFRPIDVARSQWQCTLEPGDGGPAVRLGLRYVRGLRREAAERLVARRPFGSVAEAAQAGELARDEVEALAYAGAFAGLGLARREALWQAAAAERDPASLLAHVRPRAAAPLAPRTPFEETAADYAATQLTTGPHVMVHLRPRLAAAGVRTARDLPQVPHGGHVRVAGHVIVRQRPGTAKGMCFLTLEDETGTANAFLTPPLYERWRVLLNTAPLLEVEGRLERRDGVTHVRAERLRRLEVAAAPPGAHDYR